MIIRTNALSIAAISLMMLTPATSPVVAAPSVASTITVGDGPVSVAFSPNGKKAYVANYDNDNVSVIKTR